MGVYSYYILLTCTDSNIKEEIMFKTNKSYEVSNKFKGGYVKFIRNLIILFMLTNTNMYSANFEKAIDFTFAVEGSVPNYAYGISTGTLKTYNKKYKKNYKMNKLTRKQASNIAEKLLWNVYDINEVDNDIVGIAVFDFIFNSNPANASKIIERTINQLSDTNVKVNGSLSSKDIAMINTLDPEKFVKALCDNRLGYMKSLKAWKKYGKGWSKRVNSIKSLV